MTYPPFSYVTHSSAPLGAKTGTLVARTKSHISQLKALTKSQRIMYIWTAISLDLRECTKGASTYYSGFVIPTRWFPQLRHEHSDSTYVTDWYST